MKVNLGNLVELHEKSLVEKYLTPHKIKEAEMQTLTSLVSLIKEYTEKQKLYSPFILLDFT